MKRGGKNYIKATTALLMVLILTLGLTGIQITAQNARTISVFEVEGDNVIMTKGTAREFAVRPGIQLSDGYTVSTGIDSYCYIKLDDDTLLMMDQQSKIQVTKASRNKLAVSVLSGAALVDAAAQAPGDSVETNAGNSSLAIRGTLYIIEYKGDNLLSITMLEGSGDVNGIPLPAGGVMLVFDAPAFEGENGVESEGMFHQIITSDSGGVILDHQTSLFTLAVIAERLEELIESGVIDIEGGDIEQLMQLIVELMEEKLIALEEERSRGIEETGEIENNVVYIEEDNTEEGEESGENTDTEPTPVPTHASTPTPEPTPEPEPSSGTATDPTPDPDPDPTPTATPQATPTATPEATPQATDPPPPPTRELTYEKWEWNAQDGDWDTKTVPFIAGETLTLENPVNMQYTEGWNHFAFAGWQMYYYDGANPVNIGPVRQAGLMDAPMPNHDVLMDYVTAEQFDINYILNGGTIGVNTDITAHAFEGAAVTLPSPVPPANRRLVRWNVQGVPSVTQLNPGASFTMPGNTVMLDAVWEDDIYTLTYDFNGGTLNAVAIPAPPLVLAPFAGSTVTAFNPVNPLPDPPGGGVVEPPAWRRFGGWYTKADATGDFYRTDAPHNTFPMPENDLTLYAYWEYLQDRYLTINYGAGMQVRLVSPPVIFDNPQYINTRPGTLVELTDLSSSEYTIIPLRLFTGWESSDVTITNNSFTMPDNPVTVTATWANIERKLTYDFIGNLDVLPSWDSTPGLFTPTVGDGPETRLETMQAVGETVNLFDPGNPPVPGTVTTPTWTPSGGPTTNYVLAAWNTERYGTGNPTANIAPGGQYVMPNNDVLMFAQWEPRGFDITYNLGGDILFVKPNPPLVGSQFPGVIGDVFTQPGLLIDEALPYTWVGFPSFSPGLPWAWSGHEFLGWYMDLPAGTQDFIPGGSSFEMPNGNVTLTGLWGRPVTIEYDLGDVSFTSSYAGENPLPGSEGKIAYLVSAFDINGRVPNELTPPPGTSSGSNPFLGWSYNGEPIDGIEFLVPIFEDEEAPIIITLEARWQPE